MLHVSPCCILAENVKYTYFRVDLRRLGADVFWLVLNKVWTMGLGARLVTVWILAWYQNLFATLRATSCPWFLPRNWLAICVITDVLARFWSHVIAKAFRISSAVNLPLLTVRRNTYSESSSQLKLVGLARRIDLWHEKTIDLLLWILCNFLILDALHPSVVLEQSVKYIVHHLVWLGTKMVLK